MNKTTVSVFAVFLILSVFVQLNDAKKFSKCEVAQKMAKSGFPRNQLPDWMCLIQSESSFNSGLKGPRNRDGSYDYGLFQINSRYWCGIGKKAGDCNIACEKFLDNDISDDLTCAKKIFKRHSFSAWYGWKNKCKGKKLPSVNECF